MADGGGEAIEAIAFNPPSDARAEPGRRIGLVYRLEVNVYRGRARAQLVVEHLVDPPE